MGDRLAFELVEVEWEDSFTEREVALASIRQETIWYTVGYLLRDDPDRIVLAYSIERDDDSYDVLSIPRGMVREMRYLKRKR